jgi:hypothetical protein
VQVRWLWFVVVEEFLRRIGHRRPRLKVKIRFLLHIHFYFYI